MPEEGLTTATPELSVLDRVTIVGSIAAAGVIYKAYEPEIQRAEAWFGNIAHAGLTLIMDTVRRVRG